MATIFRRTTKGGKPAKNYSIKFKDERGRWKTVAGHSSKELTRQKAHDLETRILDIRGGRVDPFEKPKLTPLAEHLDAFERHLAGKGRCVDHVDRTIARVAAIFDGCGFASIDDLSGFDSTDKVSGYLAERRASAEKLTAHTSNHYLTALKGFCRWAVKHNRMAASPLALMGSISTEQDDKRERRAISGDDFAKLVTAAKAGGTVQRQSGEGRAWLYMVAAYSGLRASELASLAPASFELQGAPSVLVRAAYTKNRQEARQPIRPDFAKMLAGWLAGKTGLLWPGKWYRRAAEMLRVDLEAAGIPYLDDQGRVFDFHSLRVTYITNLARAGVHPSIAQRLARHSVVTLTMGVYTRLSEAEIAEGLRGLPAMPKIGRTKRTKQAQRRTKCAPKK